MSIPADNGSHIEPITTGKLPILPPAPFTVPSTFSVCSSIMAPTLPNSDWTKRTLPISFKRMIALKPLGNDTFESLSSGYPPTAISRTYGGHVYAQAAWAAAKTVAKGQYIHNITGHFLLLGDTGVAFRYHVKRVRDGGVYCLRTVEAYQDSKAAEGGRTPCFVATVSFKRDESGKQKKGLRRGFEHQEALSNHVDTTYRVVLDGKTFEDHAICAGGDGIWSDLMSWQKWKERGEAFPGLEMRKVDMRRFNGRAVEAGEDGGHAARKWRLLVFYRLLREDDVEDKIQDKKKEGDEDERDLNLHACAHLYASDRNSLFLGQRALGFETVLGQMGSLAHTVHFHGPPQRLKMVDDTTGKRKMYIQESWTSNSGADRLCHNSRLWDYEEGRIIATTMQDGMIRIATDAKPRAYDGDNLKPHSKL
jgi:acyl-CoA thioesterase